MTITILRTARRLIVLEIGVWQWPPSIETYYLGEIRQRFYSAGAFHLIAWKEP